MSAERRGSASVRLLRGELALLVLAVLVVAALHFAANFFYFYLDDVTRGRPDTMPQRFIEEFSGTLSALVLLPGVVWLVVARPVWADGRPCWRHLPAHLAGLLAFSALKTSLMWGSRIVAYELAGLGAYDYGRMPWRYIMELQADVGGYVLIVLVTSLVLSVRQSRERELRRVELDRALTELRLQNLRLQLQPHFLFNALNTVSEAVYDDPAGADRMLGHVAELLRLSLRTSATQRVRLADELEVLAHYAALMRARFGERLCIDVRAPGELAGALVPSMLLQPLAENAARHGRLALGEPAHVAVTARADGDRLLLEVRDDGPGAPAGTDVLRAGTGLSATADRLRLLYDGRHDFTAGNEPDGFVVRLRIPLERAP